MATEGLQLVEPRSNSAGAGVEWIAAGWKLFARAPLMWIVSLLIIFVIAIVVNLVPIIGTLAFQALQPVFGAGFVVACRSLETGGEFEIEHVFAGFKRNFANLIVVGLIFMAGWIALLLVFAAFAGFGIVMAFITGNANDVLPAALASGMSILLGTLVMLFLMVPLVMAYWFAPALVMLHDVTPIAAMKQSFRGCLRNIVPFLLYGIVMLVLCMIAAIPFGLGMLVWFPVAIASTYAAYRSIYTDEAGTTMQPAMAQAA
jgi:uncharacterized membrane protein